MVSPPMEVLHPTDSRVPAGDLVGGLVRAQNIAKRLAVDDGNASNPNDSTAAPRGKKVWGVFFGGGEGERGANKSPKNLIGPGSRATISD